MHVLQGRPPATLTGGERYPLNLTQALRDLGEDVSLFVLQGGRKCYEFNATSNSWRRVGFRSFVREVSVSDVAHVYGYNTAVLDVMVALRLITRTPIVMSDMGGGTLSPGRVLGRRRLRWLDGLAAISEWSASQDLRWPTTGRKRIIYGGGDHLTASDLGAARLPQPVMRDFLQVGRILPHKGLHVVIEALPEGASLTVAGPLAAGDQTYLAHLRGLAQGKNVEFVDAPSDTELIELYRNTRFALLASVQEYEGRRFSRPELLGLVLLESFALGTPCAGSALGGSGELLALLGMPSAPAGDVLAWRTMLGQLAVMPENDRAALRAEMHRKRDLFTWRGTARECIGLYEEVVQATRSRCPDRGPATG